MRSLGISIAKKQQECVKRGDAQPGFPPDITSALMTMFDSLDADCDGLLCREEVRVYVGNGVYHGLTT